MLEAKWIRRYAQNLNTGFAIEWTKKGENAIGAVFAIFQDLGSEKVDPQVWWALVAISDGIFGPDGYGLLDSGVTNL